MLDHRYDHYTTPPATLSPSPPTTPSSTQHSDWSNPPHQQETSPDSPSRPPRRGHARVSSGVISSLIHSLAAISAPAEPTSQDCLDDEEEDWHDSYTMLGAQSRLPPARTSSTPLGGTDFLSDQSGDLATDLSRDHSNTTNTSPSNFSEFASQKSVHSVRSGDTGVGVGQLDTTGVNNRSATSVERSGIQGMNQNSMKRSSREALAEQVNGTSPAHSRGGLTVFGAASKLLRPTRSKQSLKEGQQVRVRDTTPSPTSGLLRIQTSHSRGLSPNSPDSTQSTASQNLSGHLIPSRRSSLRHSTGDGTQLRDSTRMSTSSRDLRSLDIDQDLIEEDDSTVRRIRELQDAKDKRQKEWRKEVKKSEKLKRQSMPSPKVLEKSASHQNSHSVVGILMEVPDKEMGADMGANATIAKAAEERPQATTRNTTGTTLAPSRRSSIFRARDSFQSTERSPEVQGTASPQHRRGISSTLKRSLTTNSIFVDSPDNIQASIDEEVDIFLNSSRFTQKIKHPRTGRIIAFSEAGDPEGFPVICCVGMGLTRYLTAFYDELARSLKLRLITPDRPGIGGSDPCPEGQGTPLNWADDIYVLCNVLDITKFSLLAHSAGAIYALATALRLPQYVRGQIRLLAPWIPASQLSTMSKWGEAPPTSDIPFTQKLLAVLPPSFLKVANASFMSATSASISPKARSKRRSGVIGLEEARRTAGAPDPPEQTQRQPELVPNTNASTCQKPAISCYQAQTTNLVDAGVIPSPPVTQPPPSSAPASSAAANANTISAATHAALYEESLTHKIWALATHNANPAVDLLVCLERSRPIGFRYTDVTRSVVIVHGSQDTRVSPDNARWLAKVMKRCELRMLDGEGHGLMARAGIMGDVLGEVGREWEEWNRVTQNNNSHDKVSVSAERSSASRQSGKGDWERRSYSRHGGRSTAGRTAV